MPYGSLPAFRFRKSSAHLGHLVTRLFYAYKSNSQRDCSNGSIQYELEILTAQWTFEVLNGRGTDFAEHLQVGSVKVRRNSKLRKTSLISLESQPLRMANMLKFYHRACQQLREK